MLVNCPCCGTLLEKTKHLILIKERSSFVINGSEYILPKTLFNLFSLLYQRMPNNVSNEGIMTVLYADHLEPPFNSVIKMHIMKLRKIIASTNLKIITVWGIGYRLELQAPVTIQNELSCN